MSLLSVNSIGNCNIHYVSGLSNYSHTEMGMRKALYDLLSTPSGAFKSPSCGMFLFAQGSDHNVKTQPYAHNFKKIIEENKLGVVVETPTAPNPHHANRPGIAFLWTFDLKAMEQWQKAEVEKSKTARKEWAKESAFFIDAAVAEDKKAKAVDEIPAEHKPVEKVAPAEQAEQIRLDMAPVAAEEAFYDVAYEDDFYEDEDNEEWDDDNLYF